MIGEELSIEFEGKMDAEGNIPVPDHLRAAFGKRHGHFRVIASGLSAELRKREVTDDEIERIGTVQKESREQVVKFLLAEGALSRYTKRAPL